LRHDQTMLHSESGV